MSKNKSPDINSLFCDGIFQSSTFDTIKARFYIRHNPLGEVIPYKDSQGRTKLELPNKLENTTLSVRSSKKGECLTIEGAYVKWWTGQNIIGTTNLIPLALKTFIAVCKAYELSPTAEEIEAVKSGDFELIRLDYAVHCDAGSENKAEFLQRQIKKCWAFSRPNYAQFRDIETLYVGKGSRRRTFKSYMKGRDVKAKGGLEGVAFGRELEGLSRRLIRLELTWRSTELREKSAPFNRGLKLQNPMAWKGKTARMLMKKRIRKLLGGVVGITFSSSKKQVGLSNYDRLAIAAHGMGSSVENLCKNKRDFKRLREKIIGAVGIDIALPLEQRDVAKDYTTARQLIDERIKYRSSHKLFLFMAEHQMNHDSEKAREDALANLMA